MTINMICTECNEHCEVDEIVHTYTDDAYGHHELFEEVEYISHCCGAEAFEEIH